VLVAESRAPARPEDSGGIKDWVMQLLMKRAGAAGPSADRITLLRDADGDGVVETRSVFLDGLHSPFGMALVGSDLYIANTDALVRFPYEEGQMRIEPPGETVVELPAGSINHHWTKNVIASPDGTRLYVSVGSNSNVAENGMAAEEGRAAIWEVDPATGDHRIYASGLRNPVGMAFEPETGALWTAVNERDELGSDLVPDYMTAVQDGGFYGGPTATSAITSTRGSSRSGPIWSRRRSFRTMLSARTRHRSASPLRTNRTACLPSSRAARSSASTVPGTAGRRAATRLSSCRSRTGDLLAIRRTC
jgi:glucose/arabinose dehydrogenase